MKDAYGCSEAEARLFTSHREDWMRGEVTIPADGTKDPRQLFELTPGVFMRYRANGPSDFYVQPDPSKPAKQYSADARYTYPDWDDKTNTLWVCVFSNGTQSEGILPNGDRVAVRGDEGAYEAFNAKGQSLSKFKT